MAAAAEKKSIFKRIADYFKEVKSELKKVISALKSGEIDDFFELSPEHIIYDDNYASVADSEESEIILTSEDYGVSIDELEAEEFLDTFCKITKNLDVFGSLYDPDEEEFAFTSEKGYSYYINSRKATIFNDELDAVALDEEALADDE